MENLVLQPTKATPFVDFNAADGYCRIEGKSAPEHVMQFFEPVFSWLRLYMETGKPLTFHAQFTYFNTSSSKALLDLFEMLAGYDGGTGRVSVLWHYEADDDDMRESGEEFADDVSLTFQFIELEG